MPQTVANRLKDHFAMTSSTVAITGFVDTRVLFGASDGTITEHSGLTYTTGTSTLAATNISATAITASGALLGNSLNINSNTASISSGGAIAGTSLNAGSGAITTTGTITGNALVVNTSHGITSAGAITGSTLTLTSTLYLGTITSAREGAIATNALGGRAIQVIGNTTANSSHMLLGFESDTAVGPIFEFAKYRATAGDVEANDIVGTIAFSGEEGGVNVLDNKVKIVCTTSSEAADNLRSGKLVLSVKSMGSGTFDTLSFDGAAGTAAFTNIVTAPNFTAANGINGAAITGTSLNVSSGSITGGSLLVTNSIIGAGLYVNCNASTATLIPYSTTVNIAGNINLVTENNLTTPSDIRFSKFRTTGSTIVTGDYLGSLTFMGETNTNTLTQGAGIVVVSTGTISSGVCPAFMTFQLADSAGTLQNRLSISAAGTLSMGSANITNAGAITGTSLTVGSGSLTCGAIDASGVIQAGSSNIDLTNATGTIKVVAIEPATAGDVYKLVSDDGGAPEWVVDTSSGVAGATGNFEFTQGLVWTAGGGVLKKAQYTLDVTNGLVTAITSIGNFDAVNDPGINASIGYNKSGGGTGTLTFTNGFLTAST